MSRLVSAGLIKVFVVISVCFSFNASYGLTESVDLFGQINSVDLVLNDIWIEPENPNDGESVEIRGSVYNAGIVASGDVSDAVTVGFIVNGELMEINLLENIRPGIENGVEISSGPIFDANPGRYIVTTIINYHDTLSHLRDNPENNIVQKQFQISNSVPSFLEYTVFQKYDEKTDRQKVTIKGELTDVFQEKVNNQRILLRLADSDENTITDTNGEFVFIKTIPFTEDVINIVAQVEENFSFPGVSQNIFPVKLADKQSALAIHTKTIDRFETLPLTLVIFQDSYDNLFKKVSTNEFSDKTTMIDNVFLTILPADHEYIVEVYLDGRIIDAFQSDFVDGAIVNKEIFVSESAQVRFRVTNDLGEPQDNVTVNTWVYSATTNENGLTDWIDVIPTITKNDPYVAKATLANGEVSWSEPFLVMHGEKKVIQIGGK